MSGSRARSWSPRTPRSAASAFRSRRRSESTRRIEPLLRASGCKHPKAARRGGAALATDPGTRPGRVRHGALRRFRRCKHRRMNPGRGAPVWSTLDACAGNRPGCGGPGGLGCKHPRSSVPQAGRSAPVTEATVAVLIRVAYAPFQVGLGASASVQVSLGASASASVPLGTVSRGQALVPRSEDRFPRGKPLVRRSDAIRFRLGASASASSVRGCQGWSWCEHPDLSFARRSVVGSECKHPIHTGATGAPSHPVAQALPSGLVHRCSGELP